MAKHVHVYLHGGLPAPARTADRKTKDCGCGGTGDATAHDPKDGKFTTSGAAGGSEMHHDARQSFHNDEMKKKGSAHPDHPVHAMAGEHHRRARNALAYASEHPDPGKQKEHMAVAQQNANGAAEHEAKIKVKTPAGKN